jgi:hypothetical protein
MFESRLSKFAGMTVLTSLLSACSVLSPLPAETTSDERLNAIPVAGLTLEGAVTIHWDDHQVPFIEAERDADLPVAMGLVHAHLRLGQMELLRRISQGRIAEMGGPLAADIDEGLRILNFGGGGGQNRGCITAGEPRLDRRLCARRQSLSAERQTAAAGIPRAWPGARALDRP